MPPPGNQGRSLSGRSGRKEVLHDSHVTILTARKPQNLLIDAFCKYHFMLCSLCRLACAHGHRGDCSVSGMRRERAYATASLDRPKPGAHRQKIQDATQRVNPVEGLLHQCHVTKEVLLVEPNWSRCLARG